MMPENSDCSPPFEVFKASSSIIGLHWIKDGNRRRGDPRRWLATVVTLTGIFDPHVGNEG
jgi:hypothetical protein